MSLKEKVISSLKWTTLATVVSSVLQVVQLAVLARFLEPSDFGLMAIVMVVIGFSQAFLDMGISNAIIHKQDISLRQLSTIYWVNVTSGVLVFLLVYSIAPLVADFYNNNELTNLIRTVALVFIIQPFGQQFFMLWQKEMRFNDIAWIEIATKLVSLISSIGLAYRGLGVYSIVYGNLIAASVQTLLFLLIGLRKYRPALEFDLAEIKEFLIFGCYQISERSINYFSGQADNIIIGKLLGFEALGSYDIVKKIIERTVYLLNGIVNRVAFPFFSKIQNDFGRLKKSYLRVLGAVTFVQYPLIACQFFMGYEVFSFVFGSKWLETESLIQLFAVYSLFLVFGNPIGSLLLARGKAKWSFYSNFVFSIAYPVSIFLFVKEFGLPGALYGYIAVSVLSLYPYWKLFVSKLIDVTLIEYYHSFFFHASISFLSGFIAYKIAAFLSSFIVYKVLAFATTMFFTYLGLNLMFNSRLLADFSSIRKK